MPQPTIILDACVLLNLIASHEAETILRTVEREYFICKAVADEVIRLRTGSADKEPFEDVRVDHLIDSGVLRICSLETPMEESAYVNYAGQVDDGEAMSIAIAESRGYAIATDDRKARRVSLGALGDPSRLFYTSDLIREWAEANLIDEGHLKQALLDIRLRASFLPSKNDPNHQWWMDHLNS